MLKGTNSTGNITKTYHATLSSTASGDLSSTVLMELNGTASSSTNIWLYNAQEAAIENDTTGSSNTDSAGHGDIFVQGPGYDSGTPAAGYTPDMRIDLDPLSAADTVYVWVRYSTGSTTSDTLYYNLTTGNIASTSNPTTTLPIVGSYAAASLPGTNKTWAWAKVQQYSLSSTVANALGFVWGENDLKIDQVLVTDDSAFTP